MQRLRRIAPENDDFALKDGQLFCNSRYWDVFDHLVQDLDPALENFSTVSDQPGRIDINLGGGDDDWSHINSIAYNADLDQILLSSPNMSELYLK